ncbi:ribonucleases P/MRP protein subunit POP1 [Bacillus rossius redtenbacheri]|uniref:ribonucleases P/MRP protein subunit POP1 n=1 Tax=Bacillus rossius redtenbacheri TaxID=93214 RepID=UPI002FDD2EE7
MSKSQEFDVNLGGTQNLPNEFKVGKFAKARFEEISALTQVLEGPRKSGQVFQRLPRHMRRRAMSHNSKRLPRRLREAYDQQLEKCGAGQKKKRPSRKFRRRPKNLLAEYNRRQRTHVWLETHIWHAKRFHMVQRWGYKLPLRPTDKSFRACYRATAHHCLLQDVSYHCCVELSGPQDVLLAGLARHASVHCGPTFAAASCLKGTREGSVAFYQRDAYPRGFVGPVSFTWRPGETEHGRTVWLWAHPAFYQEVLRELTTTLDLRPVDSGESGAEASVVEFSSEVERTKLAPRNVPWLRVPRLTSGDGRVRAALLKDTLARLQLTGPLSQAVLTQALAPTDNRAEAWRALARSASPAQMPPHAVLGITLFDPRFNLPPKRIKAVPDCTEQQLPPVLPAAWSAGEVWSERVRDEATAHKLSWTAVAELCGRRLVPEGPVLGEGESGRHTLPAMLIQRPGSWDQRGGLGSGWDIVLPAGHAMSVWLALVLRGARVGGLREATCQRLEEGRADPLAPDSGAGREEARRLGAELEERHFRKPPAKRPNYVKLGVSSPFACCWDVLVREWCGGNSDWWVWRARRSGSTETTPGECLVPVTVHSVGAGYPVRCALICVPAAGSIAPLEPVHADERQEDRREMRAAHRARLRRERRLRKKGEGGERPAETDPGYHAAAREAWLPKVTAIKDSCTQTVIGYVTAGDFSFSLARGVGQGYVVLRALKHLQAQGVGNTVLYRNPTTRQYRLGRLSYPDAFAAS